MKKSIFIALPRYQGQQIADNLDNKPHEPCYKTVVTNHHAENLIQYIKRRHTFSNFHPRGLTRCAGFPQCLPTDSRCPCDGYRLCSHAFQRSGNALCPKRYIQLKKKHACKIQPKSCINRWNMSSFILPVFHIIYSRSPYNRYLYWS